MTKKQELKPEKGSYARAKLLRSSLLEALAGNKEMTVLDITKKVQLGFSKHKGFDQNLYKKVSRQIKMLEREGKVRFVGYKKNVDANYPGKIYTTS